MRTVPFSGGSGQARKMGFGHCEWCILFYFLVQFISISFLLFFFICCYIICHVLYTSPQVDDEDIRCLGRTEPEQETTFVFLVTRRRRRPFLTTTPTEPRPVSLGPFERGSRKILSPNQLT